MGGYSCLKKHFHSWKKRAADCYLGQSIVEWTNSKYQRGMESFGWLSPPQTYSSKSWDVREKETMTTHDTIACKPLYRFNYSSQNSSLACIITLQCIARKTYPEENKSIWVPTAATRTKSDPKCPPSMLNSESFVCWRASMYRSYLSYMGIVRASMEPVIHITKHRSECWLQQSWLPSALDLKEIPKKGWAAQTSHNQRASPLGNLCLCGFQLSSQTFLNNSKHIRT